ncbi:uncharacterized protein LOC144767124 isoform X2 [Lissotriton helveticus]
MSSSVVRVNGVAVATDASKPTVLNINVNQPSGLTVLRDIFKSQWKRGCTTTARTHIGEQKVLGAVLLMIGLVCVSMGVLISFLQVGRMYWSSSCYWTGVPCTAAFLLHLGSLGVAIAGLVFVSRDLRPDVWYHMWSLAPEYLCKSQLGSYEGYSDAPYPDEYRVAHCSNEVKRLLSTLRGVQWIVLVSTCLALCISLYSLVSGIKGLCCTCVHQQEEEETTMGQGSELLGKETAPKEEKCTEM